MNGHPVHCPDSRIEPVRVRVLPVPLQLLPAVHRVNIQSDHHRPLRQPIEGLLYIGAVRLRLLPLKEHFLVRLGTRRTPNWRRESETGRR